MMPDEANEEDIVACLMNRNISVDDMALKQSAHQILKTKPRRGYLTISNALQWRLQYQRIVDLRKSIAGIFKMI